VYGVDERNRMRRLLLLAALGALAALVASAPVAAKGPATASITGPGLDRAVPVKGDGEGGPETPLGSLVQLGGYFGGQVFTQIPDTTRRARPSGDLGPRYRVVYRVPGPNGSVSTLVQDVYPYAKPSPVTYMPAGQPVFEGLRTHGGWIVADDRLKSALVAAGLPRSRPASSGASFPWTWTVAGIAGALALLALALRRHDLARLRTLKSPA
jgi:hypothetical protein